MIQPSQIGEKLFAKTRCHHFNPASLPASASTTGRLRAVAMAGREQVVGKCGA